MTASLADFIAGLRAEARRKAALGRPLEAAETWMLADFIELLESQAETIEARGWLAGQRLEDALINLAPRAAAAAFVHFFTARWRARAFDQGWLTGALHDRLIAGLEVGALSADAIKGALRVQS